MYQFENNLYAKLDDFENILKDNNFKYCPVYLNELSDILALSDEFKIEYICLLKIRHIIEYVFKNKKLNQINYVRSVWKSFSDLLKFRLSMIGNNNISDDEYRKACSRFREELNNHREYFYGEIYTPTHEYDSEINQIKNILF